MKKEEQAMTTKQLITKLLELDPDGNKEIYLEKVIHGAFSDGACHIQKEFTDNRIRIDNENHNIIKFTM